MFSLNSTTGNCNACRMVSGIVLLKEICFLVGTNSCKITTDSVVFYIKDIAMLRMRYEWKGGENHPREILGYPQDSTKNML